MTEPGTYPSYVRPCSMGQLAILKTSLFVFLFGAGHLGQLQIIGLWVLALYLVVEHPSSCDVGVWQPPPPDGKRLLSHLAPSHSRAITEMAMDQSWENPLLSNWNTFCCNSCTWITLGNLDLQEDDDGLLHRQRLCRVALWFSMEVSRSLVFYSKAVIPFC